jgi:hypothetical protein
VFRVDHDEVETVQQRRAPAIGAEPKPQLRAQCEAAVCEQVVKMVFRRGFSSLAVERLQDEDGEGLGRRGKG